MVAYPFPFAVTQEHSLRSSTLLRTCHHNTFNDPRFGIRFTTCSTLCTWTPLEASHTPWASTTDIFPHQAAANNMASYPGTHQLVVIAKPRPDQPYCQIATAFQLCLCNTQILHPCLHALRAFSDERHRFGILQELAFAAEDRGDKPDLTLPVGTYYQASGEADGDCRFPYITATLVSSMGSCVDEGHTEYRCSLEAPFHTIQNVFGAAHAPLYRNCEEDAGENLVEVTVGVIDITDLRKLRYCILSMPISCVKCGLRNYNPKLPTIFDVYGGDVPEWELPEYTPSSGEPISYRIEMFSDGDIGPVRVERDVEALEMLQVYPLIDVATVASKLQCLGFIHLKTLNPCYNQRKLERH